MSGWVFFVFENTLNVVLYPFYKHFIGLSTNALFFNCRIISVTTGSSTRSRTARCKTVHHYLIQFGQLRKTVNQRIGLKSCLITG